MLRFCFFIFSLLLFNGTIEGKVNNDYKGHILVSGKKISFEVAFAIEKNNLITGTSLTAKGTKDETKCKIRGRYDAKNKSISFYETVVISSKATFANLNFCLLSAKLYFNETDNILRYTGSFTGYVRGTKKKCASGTVFLESRKAAKKISQPPNPTTTPEKIDNLFSDLKDKKMISYQLKESRLTLKIWDDAQEDGDRVSIYLNGKIILDGYELKQEKKQIILNLPNKKNYLKIKALNEGKATPNTSRIELSGSVFNKNVRAHIKTNEAIFISLENIP